MIDNKRWALAPGDVIQQFGLLPQAVREMDRQGLSAQGSQGFQNSCRGSSTALKTKERPSLTPLSVFALRICLAAKMLPEASTER
jgi:hypothetical protein